MLHSLGWRWDLLDDPRGSPELNTTIDHIARPSRMTDLQRVGFDGNTFCHAFVLDFHWFIVYLIRILSRPSHCPLNPSEAPKHQRTIHPLGVFIAGPPAPRTALGKR